MLKLARRYLRRIDGPLLLMCAACSVLSVVVLVSIGQNQLGSINKASVQFIASALGLMLALALLLIAAFMLYYSVARSESFKHRFVEMACLSVGVAAVSFLIGYALKTFTGIEA